MCAALVLLVLQTCESFIEVNKKQCKDFETLMKRFERLEVVLLNIQWRNLKIDLDHKLEVRSDTFWWEFVHDLYYKLQKKETENRCHTQCYMNISLLSG